MTAKIEAIKVKAKGIQAPHDLVGEMTELEFHQRLVDDDKFLLKVMQYTLGVSDTDWKRMPEEIRMEIAEPLRMHGKDTVQRIKNPILYHLAEWLYESGKLLDPVAKVLGYASMGFMLAWWISWLISAAK